MALMERADALGNPADWLVVRASHNRSLPEGDKLWERTTCGEAVGEIAFTTAARQEVKAHTGRQRLWLERVQLPATSGAATSPLSRDASRSAAALTDCAACSARDPALRYSRRIYSIQKRIEGT